MIESIKSPADIKGLSNEALIELAAQIRSFLIEKVSKSGGHLGPNLGVVELTMAIHRTFDSPRDVILFVGVVELLDIPIVVKANTMLLKIPMHRPLSHGGMESHVAFG